MDLLEQALKSAVAVGVDRLVVIANGLRPQVSGQVAGVLEKLPVEHTLLIAPSNCGSAGGYFLGLEAALTSASQNDWILLLDDDNVIDDYGSGSVREAMRGDAEAVVFERDMGGNESDLRAIPGSFLYFDLFSRLVRQVHPRRRRANSTVLYAPYGGLMMSSDVLRTRSIRPNRDFLLYEDDTDFTSRLVASGVEIRVHPGARVTDIDTKWAENEPGVQGLGPLRLIKSSSVDRSFLAIRNRTIVDKSRCETISESLRLYLNLGVYTFVTTILAVLTKSIVGYKWYLLAVRDGLAQDASRVITSPLNLRVLTDQDVDAVLAAQDENGPAAQRVKDQA